MTRPRLVATDLDGTLLRKDGVISERTRRALQLAGDEGAEVVLITARPPRFVDVLTAAYGLSGTAVCSNGALVYDMGRRTVLTTRTLSAGSARRTADALAEAVPGIGFAVETGHKVMCAPGYGLRLPEDADAEFAVPSVEDLWTADIPIVKLLAWSARHDADTLLAAAEHAAGPVAQFTHSGGTGLLEVSAAGVTKAGTLSALCADRGIDASEVIAFGDMPNDLSILHWAGTGYAVANAHADVLSAVARHTASNEEDGVAAVLERLFEH
ncbi:HAD family hydrolase [Streptomyces roseofulvus]|uniref:HAD family hydrolase n=2 Tax=Streptomyces TaxID=1883 RepID=A0ABU4K3K0_9ACTN|nr:HAD family hydrolase [Streptomyces roseolus]MDX2292326.1 HAD family hydrolase [Streptomyces roseolus]